MNPFKDKVFEAPQFQSAELNEERRNFLKDKDFDVDDLVEWFVDMEPRLPTPNDMITQLYYVYRTKLITDKIGMSKPHITNNVGGYLIEEFYTKLYKKVSDTAKAELFSFMPGNTQNDEMLIHYLENTPERGSGSVNNYKGKKLKKSTLEWLLDNRLGSIRDWKPEWWTPQLKTKAISKEPFAISFIPEDLLTKTEIRNWLKDEGPNNKNYIHQFWKNIPDSFKKDPEIFGRWANLIPGGITKVDWEIKKTLTREHYVSYLDFFNESFDNVRDARGGVWNSIPDEFKDDEMIELALSKRRLKYSILLDDNLELSNIQIDKALDNFLASDANRARMALKLKKMNKLTVENLDKLDLEYGSGIDYLSNQDKKELMDSDVVDYLLSIGDRTFLKKKTNWPDNIELDDFKIAKLLELLTWSKIENRIGYEVRLTEDDFVKIHCNIIKYGDDKSKAFKMLRMLVEKDYIKVSDSTIQLIEDLGDTITYDSWKAAQQMFVF